MGHDPTHPASVTGLWEVLPDGTPNRPNNMPIECVGVEGPGGFPAICNLHHGNNFVYIPPDLYGEGITESACPCCASNAGCNYESLEAACNCINNCSPRADTGSVQFRDSRCSMDGSPLYSVQWNCVTQAEGQANSIELIKNGSNGGSTTLEKVVYFCPSQGERYGQLIYTIHGNLGSRDAQTSPSCLEEYNCAWDPECWTEGEGQPAEGDGDLGFKVEVGGEVVSEFTSTDLEVHPDWNPYVEFGGSECGACSLQAYKDACCGGAPGLMCVPNIGANTPGRFGCDGFADCAGGGGIGCQDWSTHYAASQMKTDSDRPWHIDGFEMYYNNGQMGGDHWCTMGPCSWSQIEKVTDELYLLGDCGDWDQCCDGDCGGDGCTGMLGPPSCGPPLPRGCDTDCQNNPCMWNVTSSSGCNTWPGWACEKDNPIGSYYITEANGEDVGIVNEFVIPAGTCAATVKITIEIPSGGELGVAPGGPSLDTYGNGCSGAFYVPAGCPFNCYWYGNEDCNCAEDLVFPGVGGCHYLTGGKGPVSRGGVSMKVVIDQ